MKKILVTYHMKNEKNEFETAETCIELPISDKLEALADGKKCGAGYRALERTLTQIARLQGYHFDGICTIERA